MAISDDFVPVKINNLQAIEKSKMLRFRAFRQPAMLPEICWAPPFTKNTKARVMSPGFKIITHWLGLLNNSGDNIRDYEKNEDIFDRIQVLSTGRSLFPATGITLPQFKGLHHREHRGVRHTYRCAATTKLPRNAADGLFTRPSFLRTNLCALCVLCGEFGFCLFRVLWPIP
jgi:hypothetical protein